jgi:hypothetical protein
LPQGRSRNPFQKGLDVLSLDRVGGLSQQDEDDIAGLEGGGSGIHLSLVGESISLLVIAERTGSGNIVPTIRATFGNRLDVFPA